VSDQENPTTTTDAEAGSSAAVPGGGPGTLQEIERIEHEGRAALAAVNDSEELERVRVAYLGRRAQLPQLLRGVAQLEPAERGAVGKAANQARQALEQLIDARAAELYGTELQRSLAREQIDVTLPGNPPQPVGRLHVLSATLRELEDIFLGLGFTVLEGPEVETVHYNFDALNHSPTHPARARTDTFYVRRPDAGIANERTSSGADAGVAGARLGEPRDLVLRTHTSPMQIRAMEAHPPPLYVVIPGRVYRPDSDATHTPQFHQVEGLAVDEDVTLADLKGTLLAFARAVFGDEREVRLRPHFFPFTEPSVEVDVSCFHCDGRGWMKDGARCQLCKGEGWLEVLGAGEVDPNVYSYVPTTERNAPGYDPERIQGFAWGMGVERIAMLKHGVPDLRLYYENDLRFLEQFG
jgi:phenylalanyl-tRNA synthetase alpha chain